MKGMETSDARRPISAAPREHFDYTKWRREHFANISPEEFFREATEWAKTHPGIRGSYAADADKDAS